MAFINKILNRGYSRCPNGSGALSDQFLPGSSNLHTVSAGDYNCSGNPNNIVITVPDSDFYPDVTTFSIGKNMTYRFLRLSLGSLDELDPSLLEYFESMTGSKIEALMNMEGELYNGEFGLCQELLTDFEVAENNAFEIASREFYRLYTMYQESIDANELPSSTLTSDLFTLAALCPGIHGPAIYQARALYRIVANSAVEFDDCPTPDGSRRSNYEEKKVAQLVPGWDVKVYPNPANNVLYFASNTETTNLAVSITDLSGRILITERLHLKEKLGILQITLEQGVYLVRAADSTGQTVTKKIIVAR